MVVIKNELAEKDANLMVATNEMANKEMNVVVKVA